jgi:hypothetical protein
LFRPRRRSAKQSVTCSAPSIAVIPPDMGHIYKELMPNYHLVFVYDEGQAIRTDRPQAFTDVVADFLERHEAFVISRTPTVIHP